jgi:hypothetical protein
MERIRRSMTYGNVVATMALFFAVGGGGAAIAAAAASTPSTSHGKQATIASNRGPRGPRGFRGFRGPQGPAGANGVNGVNGAGGAQGPAGSALAWASVPATGFTGSAGSVHNVGSIIPSNGVYCVTGISGSPTAAIGSASESAGTGFIVTTTTGPASGCPAGTQFTLRVVDLNGNAVTDTPFYIAFY